MKLAAMWVWALVDAIEELDQPGVRQLSIHKLARLATQPGDECAIWTGAKAGQYGYPHVYVPSLHAAMRRGQEYGHRIVCAWAYGGPPTPRHEVAHSCGVHACVNPRHLRWATHLENEADKVAHGSSLAGERNPMARLTADQVADMRSERRRLGTPYSQLGRKHGVSTMTAYRAVVGQSWSAA